jgi:SpoVK/Ycf46/Vps4 family AAA+-type ATPase
MRHAARSVHRRALDTLATRLVAEGDWSQVALPAETRRELDQLATRCRSREQLHHAVGAAFGHRLNPGLRVLFQGPSGTGKTFAASILASTLGKDLYRLEISSVVNKYIGETEKNLSRVFELAEELDVVLLLDEGEALLARRTSVQTSNDRYANLETNFLLQRLESFEGIVIVTTNAADHIDSAFQRRMDIVVDFRPPDVNERMRLWQLHLPAEHGVTSGLLRDLASRCQITGGQVRNAVLHAAVLAIDDRSVMGDAHVVAAIQREYRKLGALCPLRPRPG